MLFAMSWISFAYYLQGLLSIAMASVAMCKGFKVTAIGCVKVPCYGKGLKQFHSYRVLHARVSSIILHVVAIDKGFKVIASRWIILGYYLQGFQAIAMALFAICKGFKAIVIVWITFGCYEQGFRVIAMALVAMRKGFKVTAIL